MTFRSFFALLSGIGIHPKDTEEFYGNYGLLNHNAEFNVNAYLLSDNNDVSIKVVVFEGETKGVMSKRTEYGKKCILLSVSDILEYFESINVMQVDVTGSKRKEDTLFDFPSFREAWINACLHNDWNEGIGPSVYMYDDRIEIVSYGGLPYALSQEGFFNGTSIPVNKSLLTIFMAAQYARQSGHGVPTIVERYGREVFSFEDGMIKVSIPLSYEREEVLSRKRSALEKNILTKNQKSVYDYLSSNPDSSLQNVADSVGLSLGGVKKICAKLQEYGILERVGSKKDGKWLIKSQNLTQKELAERTGINQADISKLENGTRNPSVNLLKRLADGMGMALRIEFVPKQQI